MISTDQSIVPDVNILVNQSLFDLNVEPTEEDDTPFQGETQAIHEETTLNNENEDIDDPNELISQPSRLRRELSDDERRSIYEMLLKLSVGGNLKKGTQKMVASMFLVSPRTVRRIWKQSEFGTQIDVSRKKVKNCGRMAISLDVDRFQEIPLKRRTTLRSLASALDMKKSTLALRLKRGLIRRHSNAIKPYLSEENKISRLRFCLSMIDRQSTPDDPFFRDMYNTIHIDEKWFYMTKKKETYYLLPDEEEPLRTCKSKNYIPKIMFFVAVARPRFDSEGNVLFSGKVGVYPLITQEVAKRDSTNRPAGTLETKPITRVTRDVIRSYLIDKVIPSIKEKWPREDSTRTIFIQQDNARTHIFHDDQEFIHVATQDGFDIRLMNQPPNSPDLNVLDLGFFHAIQALQHMEAPKTIDDLISAVVNAYENFSETLSNRIFLTLQSCMLEIMRVRGSNKYDVPHVKKAMLERVGQLPTNLKCDSDLIRDVLNYIGEDF